MSAAAADPRRVLAVLFAGVLLGALDIAIVGPALPAIQRDLAVDDRALSWVFTIYVLFNIVGAPLLAKLSDRFGRRDVYACSLALFAVGSLTVALAPSFGVLLAGRALQAFGAGGIFPVASAVVADTFPPERRGRALGLIGAVFGIAFLLGPLLGGLLLRWGWHWLFLINVPAVVVVIAASRRVLPGSRTVGHGPFDARGAAVLTVLLVTAALGVNRIDAAALPGSLLEPDVAALLLAAAAAAPVFWLVERRAADPVLPPGLLRSRALRGVAFIAVVAGVVEAGMVFLPALAVAAFGVDAATASLMMLPLVLTLIVGAPVAGQLLDRIGPRPVVQAGVLLTGAGLLVLALVPLSTASFYSGAALVGVGLASLLGAPLRYVVLQEAGAARRGAGQGLLTLLLSVGQLVGAAAIGGVAASAGGAAADGYAAALLAVGVVCVAVLPATLMIGPKRQETAALDLRDEARRRS
ncbi:MAG: MFS transporter [Gammaproteobacteria bacterium]|nr:MFS transporter [Gammaproteobacteria bacterium]